MKTFANTCAQGDAYIQRIAELPAGVMEVDPVDGAVVVAHSESGHDHVMTAERVKLYELPDSILECFLVVSEPTELRHLRSFDTHEPIMFNEGVYRVRRQREYVPEGWRRAAD